jgi:hypothetical protein
MFNECRRIKDDGQRCHAAALEGKPYCFFHMKFDRMYCRDRIEIPPIEDSTSVLLAIGQVVRALNFETMDCRRAGLMLYGLQIASSVTARREQAKPVDSVRSVHDLEGKPLEFTEAFVMGAPMLAPENSICEPPARLRQLPSNRFLRKAPGRSPGHSCQIYGQAGERSRGSGAPGQGRTLCHHRARAEGPPGAASQSLAATGRISQVLNHRCRRRRVSRRETRE